MKWLKVELHVIPYVSGYSYILIYLPWHNDTSKREKRGFTKSCIKNSTIRYGLKNICDAKKLKFIPHTLF